MMDRRARFFVLCLLIVSALIASHECRRTVAAPIDVSLLTPGTNCRIGIELREPSIEKCPGYSGTVERVDQREVVLHDAVYEALGDAYTEIRRDVGTVHIPIREIVAIHFRGRAEPDADDSFDRIGVQFR